MFDSFNHSHRVLWLVLIAALSSAGGAAAQPVPTQPPSTSDKGTAEPEKREQLPPRFEWLVGQADLSYRALDLRKIEYEDDGGASGRLIPATSSGVSPGLGIGARLWFVSLMLRGDVTFLDESSGVLDDELELWNLDLESAWRMAHGRFQPYLLLGIGYSALGGISDVIDSARRAADANGANLRLGGGFDYYFHRHMTLGFRAHLDGLLLASRVSVAELATPERVDTLGETKARLREADGSIMGLGYAAGLTFAVHYP